MSDHDSCRSKVCVICIRKATRKASLSDTDIRSIREFVNPAYDVNNPDYPCGICNSCYIKLNQKRNGKDITLPITEFSPNRSLMLRSSGSCDSCTICEVAKAKLSDAQKLKPKKGRPMLHVSTSKVLSLCANCLTDVFPGSGHTCSVNRYRQKKIKNLEKLAGSPTTVKKFVARASGDEPPSAKRKVVYSADEIGAIRKNNNLSTRQTIRLAQDLRTASGSRNVIEPHLKKKLVQQNHRLDDFFVSDSILFLHEDKAKKETRKFYENVVIVNDVKKLIDEVLHKRLLEREEALIRIGLDGGGGFVKTCMSVFNLNSPSSSSSVGKLAKKFKDSGVKKALILGIVPGVQENYINIKKLWLSIGLHKLSYKFVIATDLKLCNVLMGLQNHSSMHPCCWCDIDRYHLHRKGNQRTFSSLVDKFYDFFDSKSDVSRAKEFGNVIHPPIIDVDDLNTPVIHKVPPPELHLMMGPTNHLYSELSKVWPGVDAWLQSIYIKKTDYHGGCFEGNDCRKILNKVDSLEERCPEDFRPFTTTFRDFNNVVKACYSTDLSPDYKAMIRTFTESYMRLHISVTPKVHAVMFHVEEFCEYTGMGLGPWSEQTSEALHKEFSKCWEKFYVKDSDNPKYQEQLLAAVKHFNSMNL